MYITLRPLKIMHTYTRFWAGVDYRNFSNKLWPDKTEFWNYECCFNLVLSLELKFGSNLRAKKYKNEYYSFFFNQEIINKSTQEM